MNQEIKNREDIAPSYKWNIEKMYPDESKWESDLKEALTEAHAISELQGHLTESPEQLLHALNLYAAATRKAEYAFVYSRMKHDEDNGNSKYTGMNNKAMSALAQLSSETAFIIPEILSAPEGRIEEFVDANADLQLYRYMLETILRGKPHTLSAAEERVISTLSEALDAPDEAYSMLTDADMTFGTVTDANGNEIPLTHGNFITLMESENPSVRKDAFETLYRRYREYNNTISTLYNYNVKKDVILSRLRNYSSALSAALSPENIPESVYHNLIHAVHEALPVMHRYVGARKKALKLDSLHMYDVYTPLVSLPEKHYTFEEAVDIACEALKPLGEDYVSTLRNGILEERWVDIMENKGKTSGAYSFGVYDSDPYILMNFKGTLKDIFTLVHEGGHSMHSWYTRKTQPYIYGEHSIFTAEVASTVNETLLIHYLLQNTDSPEMRKYLINFYIDEFKSTLFRQTMFAEFELMVHELAESGVPLSADLLNEKYFELNKLYYGPEVEADPLIAVEWARIPHFYYNFYVYKYATGMSAAIKLAENLRSGDPAKREAYFGFLKAGDSKDVLDIMKDAGVDLSTPAPVAAALDYFSATVGRLRESLGL